MWLFVALSLNALLSSYVFPSEAALKEGECEGKKEFKKCSLTILQEVVLCLGCFLTRNGLGKRKS